MDFNNNKLSIFFFQSFNEIRTRYFNEGKKWKKSIIVQLKLEKERKRLVCLQK